MTKVLVTGATGNVGSRVVQELRGRGVSIRAFVRDPDRAAEKLSDGVDLAVGDFSDTASLHRALEGADHLFLTSTDGPQKVEHESAVIDTAASASVSRIVKLSTVGAQHRGCRPAKKPGSWRKRLFLSEFITASSLLEQIARLSESGDGSQNSPRKFRPRRNYR